MEQFLECRLRVKSQTTVPSPRSFVVRSGPSDHGISAERPIKVLHGHTASGALGPRFQAVFVTFDKKAPPRGRPRRGYLWCLGLGAVRPSAGVVEYAQAGLNNLTKNNLRGAQALHHRLVAAHNPPRNCRSWVNRCAAIQAQCRPMSAVTPIATENGGSRRMT